MESFQLAQWVELIGTGVEVAGVLVITGGILIATGVFLVRVLRGQRFDDTYQPFRQGLGRAILLGLEILVAGDIIRTVAITPSFTSIGILAGIVAIRTFLSFTLEVEVSGRWPWQHRRVDETASAHEG